MTTDTRTDCNSFYQERVEAEHRDSYNFVPYETMSKKVNTFRTSPSIWARLVAYKGALKAEWGREIKMPMVINRLLAEGLARVEQNAKR